MQWPTMSLKYFKGKSSYSSRGEVFASSFAEGLLRNPLAPVAVLATFGIILDRYAVIPWMAWIGLLIVGLGAWILSARKLGFIGLALSLAAVAALHHNVRRNVFPGDDIGFFITDEPQLLRVRGRLTDDPVHNPPAATNPLRSIQEADRTYAILEAETLVNEDGNTSVSGLVALTLVGPRPLLRAGDVIEVMGWLHRPHGPNNPGERDHASSLLDQRIRAVMLVRKLGDGVLTVRDRATWSWDSLLSHVRLWSERKLDEQLPPAESAVAAALLLGDGKALTRDDWQKYIRTGVIHVLAVSGQHLAVLAGFVWVVLRITGVRRRPGAFMVALGLWFYSSLAGGRPPVMRSAVMATVFSGAIFLRRSAPPGNGFALAWLAVVFLNPADVFDPGCQFSFLCVAVLIWGFTPLFTAKELDPLDILIDASRPAWERWGRAFLKTMMQLYALTFITGVAIMPLTAARYHLVSPVGFLIGPPAVFLASIALIAGFLQLLTSLLLPPLAGLIAIATRWSLTGLIWLVDVADKLPYGHFYVGEIPLWWLVGFYLLIAALLWLPIPTRRNVVALAIWIVVGIGSTFVESQPDGLRVTFLAVGHGGATVIETPDGRTILVDCGSATGPDITKRIIAPYLWHRHIRRIDEVFITHGDLDHYNGLPALLERFTVGQVSITPSFSEKPTPGVHATLQAIADAKIPTRIIKAGDHFSAGDVSFEVLHPPATGPPGPENARSMVMLVGHAGHTIALTGDLDLEGRTMVMSNSRPRIDVWMAPHHGGRTASPTELAAWARAGLVVAHNATGEAKVAAQVYEAAGSRFVGTWPNGAVFVISRADGVWVETFRGRRKLAISQPGMLQLGKREP